MIQPAIDPESLFNGLQRFTVASDRVATLSTAREIELTIVSAASALVARENGALRRVRHVAIFFAGENCVRRGWRDSLNPKELTPAQPCSTPAMSLWREGQTRSFRKGRAESYHCSDSAQIFRSSGSNGIPF
jgi:hypothetical protein